MKDAAVRKLAIEAAEVVLEDEYNRGRYTTAMEKAIQAYEDALWQPIKHQMNRDKQFLLLDGGNVYSGSYRIGYGWMSYSIKLKPTLYRAMPEAPSEKDV